MSEWISVTDQLPEKDGRYLVFIDLGIVISRFYATVPDPHFFQHNTTHWMPLPEPPKCE